MSSHMPLRILVVDNNEPVCEATAEMLESLGYRADCQTDSLRALEVFSRTPTNSTSPSSSLCSRISRASTSPSA